MTDSPQSEQFVIFRVGEEVYAVPVRETQEVLRYREAKRIPHAPAHVLGVLNLRGQIVPVVGLREKFSLDSRTPDDDTRIIILNDDGRLTGIVCDVVERVVIIPAKNIEENPDFTGKRSSTAIRGVAHIEGDDSVIFLLSLKQLTEVTT